MFVMVDCVREMTVKKSCMYGEYGSFGHLLFSYEINASFNKYPYVQNAIHVTRDFVGCATLKRYYSQLNLMNGRFPMGEGGESAITFTW